MGDNRIFGWRAVEAIYDMLSGENGAAMVGAGSIQVQSSPTVATTVYAGATATPVCVGSGVLNFTNAMRKADGTGVLQSLDIVDTDNIKAPLMLILFNQNPSAGTYTDKSAPVFSTDSANIIRAIPINTSDYQVAGGVAIADLCPGSRILTGVGSANIYGVLVTPGTPTFTHSNALTVKLGIMRD